MDAESIASAVALARKMAVEIGTEAVEQAVRAGKRRRRPVVKPPTAPKLAADVTAQVVRPVQILRQLSVQRACHAGAQNQQLGHALGLDHVAVDLTVDNKARDLKKP